LVPSDRTSGNRAHVKIRGIPFKHETKLFYYQEGGQALAWVVQRTVKPPSSEVLKTWLDMVLGTLCEQRG